MALPIDRGHGVWGRGLGNLGVKETLARPGFTK